MTPLSHKDILHYAFILKKRLGLKNETWSIIALITYNVKIALYFVYKRMLDTLHLAGSLD